MATLAYRRNSVQRIVGSTLAPAASYTVVVYKPGAQVNGNQSSVTSVTVRAGHGLVAGDIACVVSGGAVVANTLQAVSSVTATTVVFSTAISVSNGDYILNLGADGGSTTPDWAGSDATIYSDMAGGTSITNSQVTTDSGGEYEYWTRYNNAWEVVLSSGSFADLIPGYDQRASGIVRASEYASAGAGTSASPFTGWEAAFTHSNRVHFDAGYYSVGSTISIATNGTTITGDGPWCTFINSSVASGGAISVDLTAAGNNGVITIRDVSFQQITNALGSGEPMVKIVFANRFILDNVSFLANDASDLTSSGTAISVVDVNLGTFASLHVQGYDAGGRFAIGADLCPGVSDNRGNITFTGGLFERCTTGVRVANGASNLVNNISFFGTKFVLNGSAAQTDGVGLDCYTYLEGLVLSGCHFEAYNNAISLDSVRAVVIDGCNISGFSAGTTPIGIKLTTACEHVRIERCRFSNQSSAGTGVSLDATAHVGVHLSPCRFSNVATPLSDSSSSGTLNDYAVAALGGGFRMRDATLTIGRNVDETIKLTFDAATGDQNIQWSQSNNRFEVSGNLYVTGTLLPTGRVDVGSTLRLPAATQLTIASDAVTMTQSLHTIETQGGAGTDDLATISGGTVGTILVISPYDGTHDVVVKHGTGNIKLAGAADFTMNTASDRLTLLHDGSNWYELARSDSG